MNTFFSAQFSNCPLTWMFLCTKHNNKINRMHEKCLCIVYNDNTSSYEELLEIDNSVSVHHRNLQIRATELYKIVNGLSPDTMKNVFPWIMTFHITPEIEEHFIVDLEGQLHMSPKHYPLLHQNLGACSNSYEKSAHSSHPHPHPPSLYKEGGLTSSNLAIRVGMKYFF